MSPELRLVTRARRLREIVHRLSPGTTWWEPDRWRSEGGAGGCPWPPPPPGGLVVVGGVVVVVVDPGGSVVGVVGGVGVVDLLDGGPAGRGTKPVVLVVELDDEGAGWATGGWPAGRGTYPGCPAPAAASSRGGPAGVGM